MIDDHVLLSDISDTEYDSVVEKSLSVSMPSVISGNNNGPVSSFPLSESSQVADSQVLYTAVPLYDARGHNFCTSGNNTFSHNVPLTTATATKPSSLISAGNKNVQFSDQVTIFDNSNSDFPSIVVSEPVKEERQMPPIYKMVSSSSSMTGGGRQTPPARFHSSNYVSIPAFEFEERQMPQRQSESQLHSAYSDTPLIRKIANSEGHERRQYFWPEAVGNDNFNRKRSFSYATGNNQTNSSKQKRFALEDLSVEVNNEFFQGNNVQNNTDTLSQQSDVESVLSDHEENYDPDFQDDFLSVISGENAVDSGYFDFVDLQYGGSDKRSPPIVDGLATKIDQVCVKKPALEKLDKILEKFAPPENCNNLVVPKVNEELWYDLGKFPRSNDLAMQNIQKYLIGGMSAVTAVLNDIVSSRQNTSSFDVKKGNENLFYALTLLGYSSYEMSMRRRFALRPHIHPAYRNVCRHTQPLSTFLFGDNLPQSLENIGKGNKIKNKLNAKNFGFNRNYGNRNSGRKRGQGGNFVRTYNPNVGRNVSNRQFGSFQDRFTGRNQPSNNVGNSKNARVSNSRQTDK